MPVRWTPHDHSFLLLHCQCNQHDVNVHLSDWTTSRPLLFQLWLLHCGISLQDLNSRTHSSQQRHQKHLLSIQTRLSAMQIMQYNSNKTEQQCHSATQYQHPPCLNRHKTCTQQDTSKTANLSTYVAHYTHTNDYLRIALQPVQGSTTSKIQTLINLPHELVLQNARTEHCPQELAFNPVVCSTTVNAASLSLSMSSLSSNNKDWSGLESVPHELAIWQ